jgi:hypothetical protein
VRAPRLRAQRRRSSSSLDRRRSCARRRLRKHTPAESASAMRTPPCRTPPAVQSSGAHARVASTSSGPPSVLIPSVVPRGICALTISVRSGVSRGTIRLYVGAAVPLGLTSRLARSLMSSRGMGNTSIRCSRQLAALGAAILAAVVVVGTSSGGDAQPRVVFDAVLHVGDRRQGDDRRVAQAVTAGHVLGSRSRFRLRAGARPSDGLGQPCPHDADPRREGREDQGARDSTLREVEEHLERRLGFGRLQGPVGRR